MNYCKNNDKGICLQDEILIGGFHFIQDNFKNFVCENYSLDTTKIKKSVLDISNYGIKQL